MWLNGLKARDLRLLLVYILRTINSQIVCAIQLFAGYADVRLAPGGGGVCSSLDTFDRAPSHHFGIYGAVTQQRITQLYTGARW